MSDQGKPPAHDEDVHYAMLLDFVTVEQGFHLAVGGYTDERHRNEVIARLKADAEDAGVQLVELDLYKVTEPDPVLLFLCREALEAVAADPRPKALSVIGLERHLSYQEGGGREKRTDLLPTANFHRDAFPKRCPVPLILWANPLARVALMMVAPDLWHWRNGTFFFDAKKADGKPAKHAELIEAMLPRVEDPNFYLPKADGEKRIALLRELLKPDADPLAEGERRSYLLLDLADSLERSGDYQDAEKMLKEALEIAGRSNDINIKARCLYKLGIISYKKGDIRASIKILEDSFFVDNKDKISNMIYIDVNLALSESYRMIEKLQLSKKLLENIVVPACKEINYQEGLIRSLMRYARILYQEEKYDNSIKIIENDIIPIIDKKNIRMHASLMYDLAKNFYKLGNYNRAFDVVFGSIIPNLRSINDIQFEATAWGLGAVILTEQGKIQTSIEVQKEKVIPVMIKIGALRTESTTRYNMGRNLLLLDPVANREEARTQLCAARAYFAEQQLPELQQVDAMLAQHGLTCDAVAGGESPP